MLACQKGVSQELHEPYEKFANHPYVKENRKGKRGKGNEKNVDVIKIFEDRRKGEGGKKSTVEGKKEGFLPDGQERIGQYVDGNEITARTQEGARGEQTDMV